MSSLIIDVSPQLIEAIRTVIREELDRKGEQIRKTPKSLTRHSASKILNCSLPTIDKYIRLGWIESRKVGRKVIIPESSISKFLYGENGT